jgi:hypothetical protein
VKEVTSRYYIIILGSDSYENNSYLSTSLDWTLGLDAHLKHLKQVTASAIVVADDGPSLAITREFQAFSDGLNELATWPQSLNP